MVLATHHSTVVDVSATIDQLAMMVSIIRETSTASVRIKAARVAARLAGELRDGLQARLALEAVEAIAAETLTSDQKSILALSTALLRYHTGEEQFDPMLQVESLVKHAGSSEISVTTSLQLENGLGSFHSAAGRYSEAAAHLEEAHAIATRLGNDALARGLEADIALCLLRLGRYEDTRRWAAEHAVPFEQASMLQYDVVLAAYCRGFASAMEGRVTDVRTLFGPVEALMDPRSPAWVTQSWQLYCADVLFVLGTGAEAYALGRAATTEKNARPHAKQFAGRFARWLARTSDGVGPITAAMATIEHFIEDLDSYDALDRAEILCARIYLNARLGTDSSPERGRLQEQLASLPEAVSHQLRRLGMLDG